MKLKTLKKKLIKNSKFKEVYLSPPKFFEEGSYFDWINADGKVKGKVDGKTKMMKAHYSMKCRAVVVENKGKGWLLVKVEK